MAKWANVKDWPYAVSEDQRVKDRRTGKILSPYKVHGSSIVRISKRGKEIQTTVAQLYFSAFGIPPSDRVVQNRKNGHRYLVKPLPFNPYSVGGRVRQARIDKGLTLEELAFRAGLKISTLLNIEHEKCPPKIASIEAIADALHQHPDVFWDEDLQCEAEVVHHSLPHRGRRCKVIATKRRGPYRVCHNHTKDRCLDFRAAVSKRRKGDERVRA